MRGILCVSRVFIPERKRERSERDRETDRAETDYRDRQTDRQRGSGIVGLGGGGGGETVMSERHSVCFSCFHPGEKERAE